MTTPAARCPHGLLVYSGPPGITPWPKTHCRSCHTKAMRVRPGRGTPPTARPRSLPVIPPCVWEGPVVEHCTSPDPVRAALTHVRMCSSPDEAAPDKCRRGAAASGGVVSCPSCPLYTVPLEAAPTPQVRSWVVGVTFVGERIDTTLPATRASLRKAGFPKPSLFQDGDGPKRVGAFGNWVLSAWEMYLTRPDADFYLLVQDDVVFCTGVRAYLEAMLDPAATDRYWNLYSTPETAAGTTGFSPSPTLPVGGQVGRGALALVFTAPVLRLLLSSPHLTAKAASGDPLSRKNVDGAVVTALNKAGVAEHVSTPSLVQHEGIISTLGHRPGVKTPLFPGEGFDAGTLLRG